MTNGSWLAACRWQETLAPPRYTILQAAADWDAARGGVAGAGLRRRPNRPRRHYNGTPFGWAEHFTRSASSRAQVAQNPGLSQGFDW